MMYRRQRNVRSARALVCIVVCMAIATTITIKSMRTAIRVRRQMAREIQMEQTRWLLRAASLRAANHLQTDTNYSGEELNVSAAVPNYDDATIQITVTPMENGDRMVAATCRIGIANNPVTATKRSGRWLIEPDDNETNQ